jgi:hypothetical protein
MKLMLSKEDCYRAWAPAGARWSQWVKPVLFSFVGARLIENSTNDAGSKMKSVLPVSERSAYVLELPGPEGVYRGVELARHGYHAVPLYNALPFPISEVNKDPGERSQTTVAVERILAALYEQTPALGLCNLSVDAPPAFLLDADRRKASNRVSPGIFDNRSVCFTTDFPSAGTLSNYGIKRVILVRESNKIEPDLLEVLLCWQQSGIDIFATRTSDSAPPTPITLRKPFIFQRLWHKMLVWFGTRRGDLGAFGGIIPSSSG